MARKGKGKPERFIKKFKTGATVVFTQQSKHYLTCETSTESTNRPRQITNKKNCSSPEMTESFLYLVDLKPLTTIIPPLCLLTVPRPSVFTASSFPLVLVLQKNYGDEHRHGPPVMSDNVHVNALFNDVTVLYTAREHHEKQNPAHVQNVTLK